MTKTKQKSTVNIHPQTKKLARLMGFKITDIPYNRHGMMSRRQLQQMRNRLNGMLLALGGLAISLFLGSIGYTILIEGTLENSMGFIIFMGILSGFIMLVGVYFASKFKKDIAMGRVFHIAGTVQLKEFRDEDNKVVYSVNFGTKKSWSIEEDLYNALKRQHVYVAYFTEKSDQLLAIEVIDPSLPDLPDWMQMVAQNYDIGIHGIASEAL